MKKLIYDLMYMDNGCVTSNATEELQEFQSRLEQVFAQYQFKLQKFVTNHLDLQNKLDANTEEETPK